jgi:hypothetical protein
MRSLLISAAMATLVSSAAYAQDTNSPTQDPNCPTVGAGGQAGCSAGDNPTENMESGDQDNSGGADSSGSTSPGSTGSDSGSDSDGGSGTGAGGAGSGGDGGSGSGGGSSGGSGGGGN